MGKPPSRPPESPTGDYSERQATSVVRLEDAIERVLEGKVQRRDIPEVARRLTQIAVSEQFSGPMPHPKHLREYDEILPGAAERILTMAERNLAHGIAMDEKMSSAEISDRKLGMWLGATIFTLLIAGAFASIFFIDSAVVPGLFLGTAAIGGVVAFIRGRNGK